MSAPRNLEIELLRTFAAVADSGSFTAAAERVARTQSAVSMQIKRLEEVLGRRVLERSSRSLALTGEGELLLAHARRMIELNDESVQRIARPAVAGRLRLGVTEYFVPNELPALLAGFAAAYPKVQLEVRMGLSGELRREMAAGKLDAAMVRMEDGEEGEPVWREPQHWVAREGWVAARGAPIPLVALPAPCVLRAFAIEAFEARGRQWHLAFTGSSMASVQAAVRAGLGVSIMPGSSVLPGIEVLARRRDFPDPGELRIGLVHAVGARAEIVAALEGAARDALAAAPRGRMAVRGRVVARGPA